MNRLEGARRFYDLLAELAVRTSGPFTLSECSGRLAWPQRGVYLFFEDGENRLESGSGNRVVRIGTHALGAGSSTTLWGRLSQHAGTRKAAAGNHRGSIFRLLIGEAIKRRDGSEEPRSWGLGGDPGIAAARLGCARADVKVSERPLEQAVSRYLCAMPFLFVRADDDAGPGSIRGAIERNAIALLSNYDRPPIDPPSPGWLGRHSGRERVRGSGLWNNNHVDEAWNPGFLDVLEGAIRNTPRFNSTKSGS